MYLKSIEINGFKSFANKITFKFNSGITAIVGPNGSGKSNVADAVRWVLGEQSAKQLRGSKMEDVIFSGTQLRKPMSYAYVAITFDNSDRALNLDYEEVTVARRVYRSGESEYILNGSTCRLRDVQELFFDTGIGKEGYSIIGQGQIDKILSGKPEDRRELFDEAAGIVKYKKRKSAAEKELDEERLNLSRITDILSEIEKQVGPLEKQSETAKEYLKLKEELKKYEINLFLNDYEKNVGLKEEAQKRQEIVKDDIESTKTEYENTKKEYERLENEISEYTDKIDADKEKKNEILINQEKKDGEIKLMEERKKSLFQSNAIYEQRKETIVSETGIRLDKIKELKEQAEEVRKKITDLSKTRENSDLEMNEIHERIKQCVNEIEQCNVFLMNLINDDTAVKTELSRLETLNEQNAIKKAELTKKVLSQKNFEIEYETAVETFNRELSEIDEQMKEINLSIGYKEQESIKLKERLDETSGFLEKFQKEKIELDSRAGALKDFTERYEGYGNSVKKVMERKPYLPGILGVVADIIQVNEKYETAIETALGGNIQNVVTKDEPTAKKLIEYLKENRFGRATFLPLDAITAKEAEEKDVLSETGVIDFANKLVKAGKEYNELIKYLLGRIIVCDNVNNALKLAKKYNYSLRIVTLEGEMLTPGGSISGGYFKNNSNLLGRKREMEEAEKKSKEIMSKINALTRERDGFKEKRDKLRDEVNRSYDELKKLEIKQNTVSLNLTKEEERLKESKQSFSVIELGIKELDEKTAENNKTAETLNERLSENERLRGEANEKIEQSNHKLDEERRLERYANEKAASFKVENAGHEQTIGFIEENIARLEDEIGKFNNELEELGSSAEDTDVQIDELNKQIKYTNELISEWKITLVNLDKSIQKLEEERDGLTKGHKDFFNAREALSDKLNALDKEAYRIENQLSRMDEVIDEQCAYMWSEYEITVDVAREQRDESLGSAATVKKGVADLKSKIRNLGDVNVNAIEQYKEVSERYNLYTTQKNDIVAAEEKLNGIISTLEDEMRKQFSEKFALIKDEFDVVFRELFGGGQGTLELSDEEDDILLTGIKINAQPPGKKLQNMMMLSGGERALTAIALLFAIQNLKPSPFCLLDEIEAALDDSNVGRYAKYLHKLTDHTQFIVITHRRGTMASADALYGITMQEKGVSALVSVSLIESTLSN